MEAVSIGVEEPSVGSEERMLEVDERSHGVVEG
jgi:hypothetical protein